MTGTLTHIFRVSLLTTLVSVVTACGPGAPKKDRSRAVGLDTPMGQVLTKSRWCTTPSEDASASPTFIKLSIYADGTYLKKAQRLNSDFSLDKEVGVEERGKWALIQNQFYTRATRHPISRSKLNVRTTTVTSEVTTPTLTKTSADETCVDLTNAAGVAQSFCSCEFQD